MSVPHTEQEQPAQKKNKLQKKIDKTRLFILTKQAEDLAKRDEQAHLFAPCHACQGGSSFWLNFSIYCGIGIIVCAIFLAIAKKNEY
jgi:hypothetical protein